MKILVLLNIFLGCIAVHKNSFRIFRGNNAIPGEFSHMISVQSKNVDIPHICGGSIVRARWVLTAAHCSSDSSIKQGFLVVVAGAWDLREPSKYQQTVSVYSGIVHPDYTGGGVAVAPHDIAMLFLVEPLVWNDWVKPVILARPNTHIEDFAIISGWGMLSEQPDVYPNILQRANMRIIPLGLCYYGLLKIGVKTTTLDYNTDICAKSSSGQAICFKDSGSPFGIWKGDDFIQVGIAVWTVGDCGDIGNPSVFLRVATYTDWIYYTMGE